MSAQLWIDNRTIEARPDECLFDCAERMGIRIPTSCFKNGKCKECVIEVAEGASRLSGPEPEENHLPAPYRLSCRARIISESGRVSCRTLRRSAMRIEERGVRTASHIDRFDPAVARRGGQVFIDGRLVEPRSDAIHGLAIDIGTTTIIVRLVDLDSGASRETRSFENPQRFGGSDIMARIQYDSEQPRLLQRTLLNCLAQTIGDLEYDPESILEIVVAGNSTMRDLFFGLDVSTIGQKPYRSISEHEFRSGRRKTTSLKASAKKLRLPAHPAAQVYGLPLISGHVGADAAACLLAIGMTEEERLVGMMDIGTNTEFIVGDRNRIFVASCPAGPAFEGGLISCGMPGLEGAIESVRIGDDGGNTFSVIGGGTPEGICGSGLIDLLSELYRTGSMNELGRLVDESDRFVLDPSREIFLSEEDISQLAQAKGANAAGAQIVSKQAAIPLENLAQFYLAGGFGRHIDLGGAKRIGLIPNLADERIVQIGNATIEGATIALLSVTRRRQLEQLVQSAIHVELETDEDFFDHFVDGCQFKSFPAESARSVLREHQAEGIPQ